MAGFVKGKSGNPAGRPKTPRELLDCTPLELRKTIWRIWKMEPSQLQRFATLTGVPVGELAIASVMAKAIKNGDPTRLEFLMQRLVGKVKDVVEIEGNVNFAAMTREEALKALQEDYAVLPAPDVKDGGDV